jgi:hypothetical protein
VIYARRSVAATEGTAVRDRSRKRWRTFFALLTWALILAWAPVLWVADFVDLRGEEASLALAIGLLVGVVLVVASTTAWYLLTPLRTEPVPPARPVEAPVQAEPLTRGIPVALGLVSMLVTALGVVGLALVNRGVDLPWNTLVGMVFAASLYLSASFLTESLEIYFAHRKAERRQRAGGVVGASS